MGNSQYHNPGIPMRSRALKPLDFFIIGISAVVTTLSAFAVYGDSRDAGQVIVQGEGATWVFPLEAEEKISISGPIGETVVEISGGRSRVLSSPCANQTCVAAGHLNRRGQWAACLPNRVFVYIEGTGDGDASLDSTTW
jgi:hypothetical protein